MSNLKPLCPPVGSRLTFFQQFLRHPLQIGSVIPSSRFLERRVLDAAGLHSAKTVVELGPGTAGTTQTILNAMPRHAKLLSIEINPLFHSFVSSIEDQRLIPHLGSACELREILTMYGLSAPDVVISGIPFSTMGPELGNRVLEAVSLALAPNGRFVAYQFSKKVADLCEPFMGSGQVQMELFNIPPMRVYRWEKNGV